MNKQLLRRVHEVKYREIRALIGQKISISSLEAIAGDVAAAVSPYTSSCGTLELRFSNMQAVLAKDKMLDLRFATSSPVLSRTDRVNRKVLESLGLVTSKDEIKTMNDVIADIEGRQDLTFLADMVKEAQAGEEWVKVFLDVWPARDALGEYREAKEKVQRSGVSAADASSVAFDALLLRVADLFPGHFLIRDACITNSDSVWFNKHFYM